MPQRTRALITTAVAAAVALTAVAQGGFSVESRAVIALLTWVAVLAGLVSGAFPRSRPPQAALVAGSLLAGLAVLTLVSVAWATDNGLAVQEFIKVSGYLGLFTLVVCASREGELRAWLAGLAIGIVIAGALALFSRLIPGLPGGDEEIARLLPSARGRLSYPIGYWNGLAALLALGCVLLTWFATFARTVAGRAVAISWIPMLGLGMYLTSSRGGFAALIFGLILLLALGPRRPAIATSVLLAALGTVLAVLLARTQPELLDAATGNEARTQGIELLGATLACMLFTGALRVLVDGALQRVRFHLPHRRVALAVGLAVLVAAVVIANPSRRFDEFKQRPPEPTGKNFIAAHLASGNGSGRWQFWSEAVDGYESEPVHGLGAGGYAAYWARNAPIDQTATHAHSLYLEMLSNLGPLGLLFVAGFFLIGPLRGILDRSSLDDSDGIAALVTIIGTGAASAAIDWTWDIPGVIGPVLVGVALLCGPATVSAATKRISPGDPTAATRRRISRRTPWALSLGLIGVVTILLGASSLIAERSLRHSRASAADGDLSKAADEARDAMAIEPWAAEPRLQLALVQETAKNLDDADATIQAAIDRAPDDWVLWLVRARIATLDAHLAEAEFSYLKARSLNPREPVFTTLIGPLRDDSP